MTEENKKREFGRLISAVAFGKTLTREESCEVYRQVILNEQPELQQGGYFCWRILLEAHPLRNSAGHGKLWICLTRTKIHTNRSRPGV